MTQSNGHEFISVEEKKYITEVINEILTKYDAQVEQQDVKQFCTDFVESRDGIKETDKVLGEVNKGLRTVNSIESYYRDLNNAQKRGKSKLSWFKATIKTITNIKDARKIAKIVGEIQAELAKTNNKQLSFLLDENVEVFSSVQQPINEQEVISETLGSIQNNSLLTVVSVGQQIESLAKNLGSDNDNGLNVAQKYFESDLDNEDLTLKKLATCGVIVANEEFHIEALDDIDGAEIAVMVDMGLTIAKVGYLLSQGKIKVANALNHIYDRTIAGGCVIVEKAFKAKGTVVGAAIFGTIGTVFGPVGTVIGGTVGAIVGKNAGKLVSNFVTDGVKNLAKKTKKSIVKFANKAIEQGEKVVKKIGKQAKEIKKKVEKFFDNLFK